MFRSQLFDRLQGVVLRASAVTKRRKQAEKLVTALSTKDDSLKMVKQL
jgi:hypothetical protein